MEQLGVKNNSSQDVTIMWDGRQVEFEAGVTLYFVEGVARGISEQDASLEVVDPNAKKEVEEPVEKKVVEPKKVAIKKANSKKK